MPAEMGKRVQSKRKHLGLPALPGAKAAYNAEMRRIQAREKKEAAAQRRMEQQAARQAKRAAAAASGAGGSGDPMPSRPVRQGSYHPYGRAAGWGPKVSTRGSAARKRGSAEAEEEVEEEEAEEAEEELDEAELEAYLRAIGKAKAPPRFGIQTIP